MLCTRPVLFDLISSKCFEELAYGNSPQNMGKVLKQSCLFTTDDLLHLETLILH